MATPPLTAYQLVTQVEAVLRATEDLSPEACRCLDQVSRHLKGIIAALEAYVAAAAATGTHRT